MHRGWCRADRLQASTRSGVPWRWFLPLGQLTPTRWCICSGHLAGRYGIIGAVHSLSLCLCLGLELVRDRERERDRDRDRERERDTLEPATEETSELCDRILDLGVTVQPTGDRLNILKIKPPPCIDVDAAGSSADMLDRALGRLGHAR